VTTFDEAAALGRAESGLAVIATLRADATIQTSVVNVAFMPHPLTGAQVAAFVTYGKVKLANLRQRPQITVTVRSGWQWAALDGAAELVGPDDPHPAVDAERLRVILREIFTAAGGTHDDWDAYDRVMREQRRTAVFVTPARIYSNG
jgi:PPOX class probable F420-dependent enzyme